MFSLTEKLRREVSGEKIKDNVKNSTASIRDRLLMKELHDLQSNSILPATCKLEFPDLDKLHEFQLSVSPKEGYWVGGKFVFKITVPKEYNIAPPSVECITPLWHPNITVEGAVCLSLLRQSSTNNDGMAWAPTRTIKDVVWGLDFLFTDLSNFSDPLNKEAATMERKNKTTFKNTVQEYIRKYC